MLIASLAALRFARPRRALPASTSSRAPGVILPRIERGEFGPPSDCIWSSHKSTSPAAKQTKGGAAGGGHSVETIARVAALQGSFPAPMPTEEVPSERSNSRSRRGSEDEDGERPRSGRTTPVPPAPDVASQPPLQPAGAGSGDELITTSAEGGTRGRRHGRTNAQLTGTLDLEFSRPLIRRTDARVEKIRRESNDSITALSNAFQGQRAPRRARPVGPVGRSRGQLDLVRASSGEGARASPPSHRGGGGGGALALAPVAERLQRPLVSRSWNTARLFGGDVRCPVATALHARKMIDVLLVQESGGIVCGVATRLRSLDPDVALVPVVRGRIGILRRRSDASPPLDNVHSSRSLATLRPELDLRSLRRARLPM